MQEIDKYLVNFALQGEKVCTFRILGKACLERVLSLQRTSGWALFFFDEQGQRQRAGAPALHRQISRLRNVLTSFGFPDRLQSSTDIRSLWVCSELPRPVIPN
jgi:hypothetical protein